MGIEQNPKSIFISGNLTISKKEDTLALIKEYIDVFARNYEDILGLDPEVAVHQLNIKAGAKPVKQQQRLFRPELMKVIEVEVKKLVDSAFIHEEQQSNWVANIIPILKKNNKIQICIDFRDLNTACLKKEFSLPITDVMIDYTCGCERISFMDGLL